MNREWLYTLKAGDILRTPDEDLLVVREAWERTQYERTITTVKIKRLHLKTLLTLKSCPSCDEDVEFIWQLNQGYKQIPFRNWTVVKKLTE
jgi:hypothetical protein